MNPQNIRVPISSRPNHWSWVFKYNLKTEEHIRVGRVKFDGKGLIELWDVELISFINRIPSNPTHYLPEWFYVESDEHGHLYTPFEPINEIVQIFDKNKEEVTGFITDDAKVIYYDQYINSYTRE